MDSENAPLLLNHEHEGNVAHGNHANTGRSQAEHLCSSCSGNLDSRKTSQTTLRHVLIFAAFLWCIVIFSLLVAHMAVGEKPTVFTVFVAIWTHVTLAVLIVLLCMGRRRHSHHKLGRTVTQIRVLCALGVSWTLLMAGIITLNTDADAMCRSYGWRYNSYTSDDCRKLFYAAHAFSWVLIVTLFSAAYATYLGAVALHGNALVVPPPPPMVPAWRLSSVADNEGPSSEGTLKI